MQELKCIEISPTQSPKATIIWLHGLGADSSDFVPMVDQLNIKNREAIRFVFPEAPTRAITINQGMVMTGWYDIYGLALDSKEDSSGIEQSRKLITNLIEKEIKRGVDHNKIIIGGFSQGGAMALYAGLTFHQELRSLISLSGYCVLANKLQKELVAANKNTPIWMAHGLFDPVVTLNLGTTSFEIFKKLNLNVTFKKYPIEHSVSLEEISDLSIYLNNILSTI